MPAANNKKNPSSYTTVYCPHSLKELQEVYAYCASNPRVRLTVRSSPLHPTEHIVPALEGALGGSGDELSVNLSRLNTIAFPAATSAAALTLKATPSAAPPAPSPAIVTVGAGARIADVRAKVLAPTATILPLSLRGEKSVAATVVKHLTKERTGKGYEFLSTAMGRLSTYIDGLTVVDASPASSSNNNSSTPSSYTTLSNAKGDIAKAFDSKRMSIVSVSLKPRDATAFRVAKVTIPFTPEVGTQVIGNIGNMSPTLQAAKVDCIADLFFDDYYAPIPVVRVLLATMDKAADLEGIAKRIVPANAVFIESIGDTPCSPSETLGDAPFGVSAVYTEGAAAVATVYSEDFLDGSHDPIYTTSALPSFGADVEALLTAFAAGSATNTALRFVATPSGLTAKKRTGGLLTKIQPSQVRLGAPAAGGEITYKHTLTPDFVALQSYAGADPASIFGSGSAFNGRVFIPTTPGYTSAALQYASTSFPAANTTPFMVAYPSDVPSIQCVLRYAIGNNKRVVPRSGGHQYCGKSSGGSDTIVVSLDTEPFQRVFQGLDLLGGALPSNYITVGPGSKLIDVATIFNTAGLTVPHGECPFVCIGGHAQTGGYGHLLTSFGLCMDRVYQFEILRSDGTRHIVTRPTPDTKAFSGVLTLPGQDSTLIPAPSPYVPLSQLDNLTLYRSVLSGNAGSYGIVLRYVFDCIQDKDYQQSTMYHRIVKFTPEKFLSLVQYVQQKTVETQQAVAAAKKAGSAAGMAGAVGTFDFTMTVTTKSNFLAHGLLIVEGVYAGFGDVPYADNFAEFDTIAKSHKSLKEWIVNGMLYLGSGQHGESKATLSQASLSFVRSPGSGTTKAGREFDEPYKKRVNCTNSSLSAPFVKAFCALLSKVVAEKKVDIIFQMGLGGSAYYANGQRAVLLPKGSSTTVTGIPHREFTWLFVFDMFYNPNATGALQAAEGYQAEMQSIVDAYFNPQDAGRELRVFWGTFDNTNITDPDVRKKYYDTEGSYAAFQASKAAFDQANLFHTDLTVQPQQQ